MFKHFILLIILFFLLNLSSALAVNPKSIQAIEIEFIKSGKIYSSQIEQMELSLYIPQEGLVGLEVYPDSWSYDFDGYGNKMVKIYWDRPSSIERYEVRMRVINRAKYFETLPKEGWELLEVAKKETELTKAIDEIREWSYGDESDLEKSVRLAKWINQNLRYQLEPLKKRTESAAWTWRNRKGVCGEFSNLLIAGLRAQGIPARYIAGYAFPQLEDVTGGKLWGHAWVEVFLEGKFVPFDPTWLEGGYLDATHIKFAHLLDSNFSEVINYKGIGGLEWIADKISIKIINYSVEAPTKLRLEVKEELKGGEVVLVEAEIEGNCSLTRIELNSCIDQEGKPVFKIYDGKRLLWFCGRQRVHWLLESPSKKTSYVCPITVFDQTGFSNTAVISVGRDTIKRKMVVIEGPEKVFPGETFKLRSYGRGLFFSPNLTEFSWSDQWLLSLKIPGRYKFYFYSDGLFGEKFVEVSAEKDFSFTRVDRPENVTVGDWFWLNVTVKNLASMRLPLEIKVVFQDQYLKERMTLDPLEERAIAFNLSAIYPGLEEIRLSAEGRSFTTYSTALRVLEREKVFGWFDKMALLLRGFIDKILIEIALLLEQIF